MLTEKLAIQKMNCLGESKTPFFFMIDFSKKSSLVLPLDEVNPQEILYSISDFSNTNILSKNKTHTEFAKHPVSFSVFNSAFQKVQKHMMEGNSYLTNLTFSTKIDINHSLKDIYYLSSAPCKLYFRNRFVVFSPEYFVRIEDKKIYSYPMKGTIDASIYDAENKILNNYKETAEHHTIVDLIRNDLSMVSRNVKVNKFRYIVKIKTNQRDLLQISSEICGELPMGFHKNIGNIIFKILPAGSISGAPKQKTLEIINETENYDRGFYTGIFGVFDGEKMETAVMIRFIENIKGAYYYKSGGGITIHSIANDEYQEMIDKIYVPID